MNNTNVNSEDFEEYDELDESDDLNENDEVISKESENKLIGKVTTVLDSILEKVEEPKDKENNLKLDILEEEIKKLDGEVKKLDEEIKNLDKEINTSENFLLRAWNTLWRFGAPDPQRKAENERIRELSMPENEQNLSSSDEEDLELFPNLDSGVSLDDLSSEETTPGFDVSEWEGGYGGYKLSLPRGKYVGMSGMGSGSGFDEGDDDFEDTRPALERFGTDITELALLGQLPECFGREKELSEMMEILARRQKNNPVLVGNAGVGKTAIIELFATRLVQNLVPFVLSGRSIVSIDLARILGGSRYRGDFELRFQRVLDESLEQPHIMIFIDEIHTIGGAGSAEGSLDAANILKPALSRSGFQCIGATTTKEYEMIEKDPALNRRFQPIQVNEPTVDETVEILGALRPSLEAFHNIEFTSGALFLAADLANRYIYDRFLPDKAIDLIDRAGSKEVIDLTNVIEGSIIGGIVNASLSRIGTLRVEAFRKGDIASEFILQEIEAAYRNYLLTWVETPTSIPKERKLLSSPLAQKLYDGMRLSIISEVDNLLYASPKDRYQTKYFRKVSNLSVKANLSVYTEFKKNLKNIDDSLPLALVEEENLSDEDWNNLLKVDCDNYITMTKI